MKTSTHNRRSFMLTIIVALIGSAVFCGRGQPADPADVDDSPTFTSPPGVTVPAGDPDLASPTPGGPVQQITPTFTAMPPEDKSQPRGAMGDVDLVIREIQVDHGQAVGEVFVTVLAANKGPSIISSSFTIRWYPHGKSDVVGCSWDITAQQIASPTMVNCAYTYSEDGEMHWRAVMDADNDVEETNEDNNLERGKITIKKAAQPAPQMVAPVNCRGNIVSTGSMNIQWDYPGNVAVDGFCIYRQDGSQIDCVGAGDRSLIVNTVANQSGFYDVRAYLGSQESAPNTCTVKP
jgi:hypothetical protein